MLRIKWAHFLVPFPKIAGHSAAMPSSLIFNRVGCVLQRCKRVIVGCPIVAI